MVGSVAGSDGALQRMDREEASRFGRGRGRPWGRVARERLGSKVKRSEWSNFGGERLLGAANGNDPKKRIQGIKKQSREGEESAARGKEDCLVMSGTKIGTIKTHTLAPQAISFPIRLTLASVPASSRLCLKLALNPDPCKKSKVRHPATG